MILLINSSIFWAWIFILFSKSNKKEILYPNIGRYEGEVKNGKPEGKGILYINGGDRLEGDFKNGIPEGKGIYYYNNGDRYEGDYKNDKR